MTTDPITVELLALVREPLTAVERNDILPLVVRGYPSALMAEELSLSVYTIKSHLSHLMAKLRVRSRGELAYLALLLGLVELGADRGAAVERFRRRVNDS